MTLLAVILAIIFAVLWNLRLPHIKALYKANKDFGSALRFEIVKALIEAVPLVIIMNNGKVMCGWLTRGPAFEKEKSFIILLPLFEGYETPEGNRKFTKTYDSVFKAITRDAKQVFGNSELKDLEITVAIEDITSVRRFDITEYNAVQILAE